jgi:hypothetical protein
MTKDYYAILGVRHGAPTAMIREAYLTLVREVHPDLHPGDETAQQRFCDIQAAFEVLSDAARRAQYDRECQRPSASPLACMAASRRTSHTHGTNYYGDGGDISIPTCMRVATVLWTVVLIAILPIVCAVSRDVVHTGHSLSADEWGQYYGLLSAVLVLSTALYGLVMFGLIIGLLILGARRYDWSGVGLTLVWFIVGCLSLIAMCH